MTRYTVAHTPAALEKLARIWLAAADRSAVTTAAAAIDRELAADADRKGRPLIGDDRALAAGPLYVVYAVSPDDRLVTIWDVGLVDQDADGP